MSALIRLRIPLLGVVLFGLLALVSVPAPDGDTTSTPWWMYAVLGFVCAGAIVGLGSLLMGYEPEAGSDAADLADNDLGERLLERWIARARGARGLGTLLGVVVGVLATNGQAAFPPIILGGLAVGAVSAELHLTRRRSKERTASLAVRRLDDYLIDSDRKLMAMALLSCLVVATGAVAAGAASASWRWALFGAVALGGVHLVQRRVAMRPRPGLVDDLRNADDLVRRLAVGQGLAWPASALAFACAGAGATQLNGDATGGTVDYLGLGFYLAAFGVWFFSRGLRLARLTSARVAT